MSEDEKRAIELIGGIVKITSDYVEDRIIGPKEIKALCIILGLIDKQRIDLEGANAYIETLKREKKLIQEDYQVLWDDIEGHNIVYVDEPEFEEKYISKDKLTKEMKNILDEKFVEDIILGFQKLYKELLGE